VVLGVSLGIRAALRQNSAADYLLMLVGSVGSAVPCLCSGTGAGDGVRHLVALVALGRLESMRCEQYVTERSTSTNIYVLLEEIKEAIMKIPPVSRYYIGLVFILSFVTTYRIVSPYSLLLDFDKVFYSLQVSASLSMTRINN
jgi:ABC-type dipeptide/oligopeptide/nickel transport system permease component